MRAARLALVAIAIAGPALADPAEDRFREANDLVRAGDYPKAVALYQQIASSGQESASLYWNWAQAAAARGAQGEALWALLRARELDPGDRTVARDAQRLREALNLDPAEIAPEPLAAVGRFARRFRLDLVALALLALSVLAHGLVRLGPSRRVAGRLAWSALALGLLAAAVPLAASHGGGRPAGRTAAGLGVADGRDDGLPPGRGGRAGFGVEWRVGAGRGQCRRPRLGPRGRRAAAGRPARAPARVTP